MPKTTSKTISKMLLPLGLVLFAASLWLLRDQIRIAPSKNEYTTASSPVGTLPQVYFGPSNSLAVLPFNCFRTVPGTDQKINNDPSSGHDLVDPVSAQGQGMQAALAFGLAEALLDSMLPMPKLQLTAADSSFYFAQTADTFSVVAERLKVRYLLGGCVRRNGEKLSLVAQLFDARNHTIRWSEHFDTSLVDLPAAIDQINIRAANDIGAGLGDAVPAYPAIHPQTWLSFVDGRYHFRQAYEDRLVKAELAFKQALSFDFSYTPAWLGLANVYLDPTWPGSDRAAGIEQARQAAEKALKLEPGLAEAHLVLSRIRKFHDWDWSGAREEAQMALSLQQGRADILAHASSVEFTFGQFQKAISLLEESIRRNPLRLQNLLKLCLAYEFIGNYDQALISSRQLLGLNRDYPAAHAYRARVKLAQHNPESALREADQEVNPFWQRYARILALDALDRGEEAEPLLAGLIRENSMDAAFQIAEIYAHRGEVDLAFDWLNRAYQQRDGGLAGMIGNQFLTLLHQDPRWQQMLTQLGLM